MTAAEFAALSTKLFRDMDAWIAEASKDETLSSADLAVIQAAMQIVERATLEEVEIKPNTDN